jgi:hypothetical protein
MPTTASAIWRPSRSSPSSATHGGSPPRATRSATPASTSPSNSQTSAARPATLPRGPPALRWTQHEAAQSARRSSSPDRDSTSKRPSGPAATAPSRRSRASRSSAATTPCVNSATRRCDPPDTSACARCPHSHRCTAAGSRHRPAATPTSTASNDRAAAQHHPAGTTPSTITSPARRTAGSRTEIRPGARAHHETHTAKRAAPAHKQPKRLTRVPCTDTDELRASRGSAIESRAELLLWRSSAGADGAPIVEKEHSGRARHAEPKSLRLAVEVDRDLALEHFVATRAASEHARARTPPPRPVQISIRSFSPSG